MFLLKCFETLTKITGRRLSSELIACISGRHSHVKTVAAAKTVILSSITMPVEPVLSPPPGRLPLVRLTTALTDRGCVESLTCRLQLQATRLLRIDLRLTKWLVILAPSNNKMVGG